MKTIQEENTALKRRLEELEAAAKGPSTEEMLAMVEARVQAQMESILMGPAQRPPLAHEKKSTPGDVQLPVSDGYVGGTHAKPRKEKGKGRGKKTAQPAPAPAPAPTIPAPIAGPSSAPPQAIAGPSTAAASTPAMAPAKTREKSAAPAKKPASGSKPKKGGRKEPAAQPAPEPRPLPPAPDSMETPWVEVARRKKKGKSTAAPTTASVQPPKPSRRKEPKLRPPRSAAVVISLTPAAMAKGLTYKSVLTDAQHRVDLTGLDISRLKPKFTATGAPMFVPCVKAEVGGRKPNDGDEVEKSMGDRPMVVEAGTSSRPEELEMDSESSLSVSSVRSRRLWRRHSQSIDNCSLLSSDTDEPPPKAPTTDGRGRGRSTPAPTTGKYVGIKKAQQERDRLKREEARKRAEEELEERLRYVKSPLPPKTDTDDDLPVLKEDLIQCGQIVRAIVRKSGNLKGTSQKALNRRAPGGSSVKRLEEENSSLRRRLEDLEASNNPRTTTEELLAMVEARVQARLESALMGPAQRPPLAHEAKKIHPGDIQLPVTGDWWEARSPRPRRKGGPQENRMAQPTVLEARPMRCYRCLESGVTLGARCDCGQDRSGLCYRCGKPGHKARSASPAELQSVPPPAGPPGTGSGKACSAPPPQTGAARRTACR
ncbi:nucleolar and coiled-body phosphoprotein 1-like [Manduca sexta]|uniref:nucleolar and coiled-body phosphoprotein 1-like n=1 Tax=Manduca sexta TaxID=7130 RepID=UPI0018907611|nr:nucleolar and coiled-body phosphoprotein 1-like [Manduca sexta]